VWRRRKRSSCFRAATCPDNHYQVFQLGRVPQRGYDGVAEPNHDGGDGDGAAVDVVAFVVAGGHGPVSAELVDCSFDGVAVAVWTLSKTGGRPPREPLRSRAVCWSSLIAMTALILRLARWVRIAREEYALSHSTASGRVLGRPGPFLVTATWARVSSKAIESWRCPRVVMNARGRLRLSAARWILVESPPRERPSASRWAGLPCPGGEPGSAADDFV